MHFTCIIKSCTYQIAEKLVRKEKKEIEEICPFWRIIEPKSKLAEKLTFGKKFIIYEISG